MRILILTVALALPLVGLAADEEACKMPTAVKGLYCEYDSKVLEKKDLASEKKYFECGDCEELAASEGECEHCDGKVVAKVSGKEVCKDCYRKPVEAEICTRDYYECPDCMDESQTARKCPDCEVDFVKKTSRAVVEYCCDECGELSFRAGKCPDEECELFGKPLRRTCSRSGAFPHVK
jgi:hypothetical protein